MSQASARDSSGSFSVGFLSGLGGQAAYLILSLPAGILLARVLGPEGKGAVDLALLLPVLVTLVANLGLGSAVSYLVSARRFSQEETLGTIVGLWLLISAILTPIYALTAGLGWLAPLAPHVNVWPLLIGALLIPFGLGRQYLPSVLLGQQRFIAYNSVPIVMALAQLAGVLLLVWGFSQGALGGVVASVAAQGVCVIYLLLLLRGDWDGHPRLHRAVIREATSYGLRGQVGNILQFFNYRLDVIVLGHFRGLREVGLYMLAVSLAEFLWYVPNASALVIFPRTAASPEEARSLTPLAFRVTGGLTLVCAVALAVVAGPLIRFVYGASFEEAIMPFFLLLPGVVCLGGAKVLSADLNGRGLPGYNAMGAFLSLVVTLGLDLILIPSHGARGASMASSTAYLTTLVYTFVVYVRVARSDRRELLRFGRSDLNALRQAAARVREVRLW